ncbi:MAG: hypothetical protein V4554_06965 [Pseudomonadota bacterium]|jgi:hypothetical protein
MSELSRYEEVRGLHAQFHPYATDMVNLHPNGNATEAEKRLQDEHSRLSEKRKHRLIGLSSQVRAAGNGTAPF